MTQAVELATGSDGIARIVIDHPPVNALGRAVRQGLTDAIDRAEADPAVRAIVLAAAGRTFPAGIDNRELDGEAGDPTLGAVCSRIEDCRKPVIAAVHGNALGGGFELALAAHYRIAAPQAHVGLPGVSLGLIPGAGGTQRLPRIAGAAVALEMMLAGRTVDATEAQRLGLVDRVAQGDLAAAAGDYARELVATGAGPRPSRERREGLADPRGYQQAVQQGRARVNAGPVLAPRRIVEAVEAAQLMPFAAGLSFEAAAYDECRESEAARALRYAYMAEGLAGRLPEFEGISPRGLVRAAVAGDGAAAAGWGVTCLDAGLQLSLHGTDTAASEAAIAAIYDKAVAAHRLADGLRGERLARLAGAAGPGALAEADLVVVTDTVLAADIAGQMRGGAILALAVNPGQVPEFAGLPRPADTLALMAGGPAHSARLVEVLAGEATAPEAALALVTLLRRLGRIPVVSPAAEGGIGPAVWGACVWAAEGAVRLGAAPEAVEAALGAYGITRSPFAARPAPERGGGRDMPAGEIELRCLSAMANAGALLVEAGVAQRPSDIDLAMIHGYGFPAWRGGPMEAADLAGLLNVQNALRALAGEDAEFWTPSALFGDLIKNGRKFADLNRL